MRPDACVGAGLDADHLAVIGARGVEEEQRVPGRGGVEDHEARSRLGDDPREGHEDRDLLVTGRAEILREQGSPRVVEVRAARVVITRSTYAFVSAMGSMRLDLEVVELARERRRDMGRRVGGAQMDGVAARRELRGDRRRDGRLSDAAFAHHHDEATAGPRDVVDERRQRRQGRHDERRDRTRERLRTRDRPAARAARADRPC